MIPIITSGLYSFIYFLSWGILLPYIIYKFYLKNYIKALFNKIGTDDVWNGTAASKTKEEFDILSAKFPEFSSAISDCHKHLLSVVETYRSVDTKIIGE